MFERRLWRIWLNSIDLEDSEGTTVILTVAEELDIN